MDGRRSGAQQQQQQQACAGSAGGTDNATASTSTLSLEGAPALTASREDVKRIVLQYLMHNTYVDSAIAFANEWDLDTAAGGEASTSSATATVGQPDRDCMGQSLAGDDDDRMEDGDVDDDMNEEMDTTFTSSGRGPRRDHPQLSKHDIRLIRVRREIKQLIQQGHIQAAMELCNSHFPSVLNANTASSSPQSSHPHNCSTATTPRASSKLSSAATGLSSRPSMSSLSSAFPSSTPFSASHPPTFPTSPLLLSLSLQIQLFIEVVRSSASGSSPNSINGSSRPGTPFSQSGHSPSGAHGGEMDGSTASLASNGTGTSTSSQVSMSSAFSSASTNASQSAIQVALLHAQSLHAQASLLPDPSMRAAYLKELETVSGLLPYHDPRTSPVAYYLDERRRDALADAVNGAILLSLGNPSTLSKLYAVVAQNETVWRSLYELKASYPPEKGGGSKGKPPKPFDMQEFLQTPIIPGQS